MIVIVMKQSEFWKLQEFVVSRKIINMLVCYWVIMVEWVFKLALIWDVNEIDIMPLMILIQKICYVWIVCVIMYTLFL